jgi:chitinase
MLRRALLTSLLVLTALIAPAAPAQAAPGLTATFSAANNGSWFLDKFVVANPTTASITGSSPMAGEPRRSTAGSTATSATAAPIAPRTRRVGWP